MCPRTLLLTLAFMQGFWQVSMDYIRLNGNKLLNIPVILDTSSNFIFGDRERVRSLYETAGGIVKPVGSIDYYIRESGLRSAPFSYWHPAVPCHSFPTVSITFSRKIFRIPPEVLNIGQVAEDPTRCFSAILGHQQFAGEIDGLFPPPSLFFVRLDGLSRSDYMA